MVILHIPIWATHAEVSTTLYLNVGRAPFDMSGAREDGRFMMRCPQTILLWAPKLFWEALMSIFSLTLVLLHPSQGIATGYKPAQLNLECALEHQDVPHITLDRYVAPFGFLWSFFSCVKQDHKELAILPNFPLTVYIHNKNAQSIFNWQNQT